MKVLWVSNSPIGPSAEILGKEYQGSSGGWVQSEYEALDKTLYQMFFLSTLPLVKRGEVLHKKDEKGEVFCVNAPRLSYGIKTPEILQKNIQEIIDRIKPDIIQIWGTETWLSNSVSKCITDAKKVVFIQGLIGVHKRYLGGYFGDLKEDKKYLRGESLLCKCKGIFRKRNFLRQADIEKETILNCRNVIVDSDFAKAYCSSISTDIVCYNHVLLPNNLFYQKKWDLKKCEKHTIFTVYGSSAEKGTQNLLKAVAIVRRKFPDVKVIIPGGYQLNQEGKLTSSKSDSFQNAMYNMIKNLDLEDNVKFTGRLSAEQMANTMEKCHIFVNPSCMEVHALSLRESMIVGLPCISAQCGSVVEFLQHKVNGLLYRYEEYESLAYYMNILFSNPEMCNDFSDKASKTFDRSDSKSLDLNRIYMNLFAE